MLAQYLLSALVAGAVASPVEKAHQRRQNVPVGTIITSCAVPGTIAVAFDDGPYIYTDQVLDTLAGSGIQATFFVNGNNYASIYDYASTIQRMIDEGHQVASHT
jgi:peptidoglycan/xylan/chitin deacetylase (PgdA/CDA1 family)